MTASGKSRSLPQLLARLWHHIGPRRQRQFMLLAALMLVTACAEVLSLGAVLPFLGILTAPERAMQQPLVAGMARALGVTTPEQLVLPLTVGFASAALFAGAMRVLLLWGSTRVSSAAGSDLSIELYRRTLYQPYGVHVGRNTSAVISGISKVGGVMNILSQCLLLGSALVLLVTITAALVVMNPFIATVSILGFGTAYGLITWLMRKKLQRNSLRIAKEQTHAFQAIQEGLGGIRDVLLDGTQPIYIDVYRRADVPFRRGQGSNLFIAGSPRYIMEALGMVLIAALTYWLSRQAGGIAGDLPMLGALALGAQRLLPALQQGYAGWASILGNQGSLADTIDLLDQPIAPEMLLPTPEPLRFERAITLEGVSFRYTGTGPTVLKDLDLTIPKGGRIGLVGATGSGKSSTLDLLMGLLDPTEGRLLVDGEPVVGGVRRAWQRNIAHVPQSIYLVDATIAENIAFGVPREQIDLDRVKLAARRAQIADFIESCENGYFTSVGERGIRLSGGQRQRIGIARALYKRARVIVFDEATSALDSKTEQAVLEAIEGLSDELTIVMVAHRTTTLTRCTRVVELANGRVDRSGSYAELFSPDTPKMGYSQ